MANDTPPKETDPQLDKNGFVKTAPFNAALNSDTKMPWLLTMAAQGKLSPAQMDACRKAGDCFDEAVAKTKADQNRGGGGVGRR